MNPQAFIAGSPERPAVPRIFQVVVMILILATGTVPEILQAAINGVRASDGAVALELVLGLAHDLLRILPLILLWHNPMGVLHPVNIAVVLWPLLTSLPNVMNSFGGYGGLLSGRPLAPPYFSATAWYEADQMWREVAYYTALQILAQLCLYFGLFSASRQTPRPLRLSPEVDTVRLRSILVGVVIFNVLAVTAFIQSRGGLIEHIMELAYGRFRALEGLGPLIAFFDIGFLAMLLWICTRPQDARSPLFIIMLLLVAAQQFLVAGSRSAALVVLVLVGLGWAMAARRVPWRLGLVVLPLAFMSLGLLNIIRTAGVTNTTAIDAARGVDMQGILTRSQDEFEVRQSLNGAVPVISDAVRTTGLMLGYTYTGAVFAMVPRAVWQDKPRGPGSLYAQYFLGEMVEGTAVPIGPVAEAYWNFHIPGVIIIFCLYGVILRWACSLYERGRGNGLVTAGFVVFATQFGVSTDQLVALQQMALTGAILLGIVHLFYRDAFRLARPSYAPPFQSPLARR